MLLLKKNHPHTEEIRSFYNNDKNAYIAYTWANEVWSPLNQRTVMGRYSNNPSQMRNPQVQSYLAKGTELRLSRVQFHQFISENVDTIVGMIEAGETPSIDRIDPNGHYEIGNIRIITKLQNWHRGNTGTHYNSKSGSIQVKLDNRLTYINAQIEGYKPKHIDFYLKNYPIRFIMMVMSNEEINQLFNYIEDTQELNKCFIGTIEAAIRSEKDKYDEKAKLDAELTQYRVEAKIAKIEKTKEEAYIKDLKKHPRYQEVYNMVYNRNRALAYSRKNNTTPKPCDLDYIIDNNRPMTAARLILRHFDDSVKVIKKEN